MRTFIALWIALLSFPYLANAQALDRPARAQQLLLQLREPVMAMNGVNAIGIGACDPRRGERVDPSSHFVHCIVISTENPRALYALSDLYPRGTRIRNVFVVIQFERFPTEPRVIVGN